MPQNSSCKVVGKIYILPHVSPEKLLAEKLKFFYSDCNDCADSGDKSEKGIPFGTPKAVNNVPVNEQKETGVND